MGIHTRAHLVWRGRATCAPRAPGHTYRHVIVSKVGSAQDIRHRGPGRLLVCTVSVQPAGRQPGSQKRKAEEELEDDRTKPKIPAEPARQEQEEGGEDEEMIGQEDGAASGAEMDTVWKLTSS